MEPKSVTKDEALSLMSIQLRKPDLDPIMLVKLVSLYSQLAGWDAEAPEQPEQSLDQLVEAAEKKRKSGVA